jgi:hypothetical protein
MGNMSIKVNLAALKHAVRIEKGKSGDQECIIIPISQNYLHKGEKGLYLDLSAFEIKDRSKMDASRKDTHLVKQSLPEEVYKAMTEEEKQAMPIVGNVIVWGANSNEPALAAPTEEGDDLPF